MVTAMMQSEIAKMQACALWIQTTIVVLDGLIQSNPDYEFGDGVLDLFQETGNLIHCMLTLPVLWNVNDAATIQLFNKLQELWTKILELSYALAMPDESLQWLNDWEMDKFKSTLMNNDDDDDDDLGWGFPKFALECNSNSLFFLQYLSNISFYKP
jgi:hypothetical protein